MPDSIIAMLNEENDIEHILNGRRFSEIKEREKFLVAYYHLERLRQLNGGYLASPYNGANGGDKYNVFWLRDIMYATYANEYIGSYGKMIESYRLILRVFHKYKHKISEGARKRHYLGSCAEKVLHSRIHPVTLEEITNEWGHHQLDIFGLFLYKTGDLLKKGHNPITTDLNETLLLLRDIVLYLTTVRWHSDPDFGVWEEGPERHSSSIGAVLSGLTMWHDDGYYHGKYANRIDIHKFVPVPEEFIEKGRDALKSLLPRESESKPYDLAQLSLIWPYNIIDEKSALVILENIEQNLVRERGVIRYPGDLYFNSRPEEPRGNEAQWPLGFAWLSIIYSKLALKAMKGSEILPSPVELINKSQSYLNRLESVMTEDGKVPELYNGDRHNKNTPLAWGQSLYIVARQSLNQIYESVEVWKI